MEPAIPHNNLWNDLVAGGDTSAKAIASFTALPERQQEATFQHLIHQAKAFIDNLIAEENKGNRYDFRIVKDKLIRVLDALPYLVVTETLRKEALKRVEEMDKRAAPLTNIDIAIKCDELAKKLAPPTLSMPEGRHIIECSSVEELKAKLEEVLPPGVVSDVIAQFEKNGGGIILSMQAMNKKSPPPKE